MPSAAILIATALLGIGVGLGCGWLLGIRKKSKRDVIIDLESRLERAQESRADYEADVAEHFAKTARLLGRMTEDYREVYTHLAAGAEKVMARRGHALTAAQRDRLSQLHALRLQRG